MLYRSCTSLPLSLKNKNISLWNFSINLNGASFLISPFTFTVYSRIHYIEWQTVARCTKERCKWLTKYIFYTKGSKVKRCYSRVSLLFFNSSFPTGEKTKKKRRHRKSPWININDPRYRRIFVTKRNEFLIHTTNNALFLYRVWMCASFYILFTRERKKRRSSSRRLFFFWMTGWRCGGDATLGCCASRDPYAIESGSCLHRRVRTHARTPELQASRRGPRITTCP